MENKYKLLDTKIKPVQTQTNYPNANIQFYGRVVNKTKIFFTHDKLTLLNEVSKYNLSLKRKHWLSNIALGAEAAITLLPSYEQAHIRYQVAHILQNLCKQHNDRHTIFHKTIKNKNNIINQIKKNLIEGKAIII
jgi:hypothetical protein